MCQIVLSKQEHHVLEFIYINFSTKAVIPSGLVSFRKKNFLIFFLENKKESFQF